MEWQIVRAKAVTVKRWCAKDKVNQEESEQNEVDGADSTGKFNMLKQVGIQSAWKIFTTDRKWANVL